MAPSAVEPVTVDISPKDLKSGKPAKNESYVQDRDEMTPLAAISHGPTVLPGKLKRPPRRIR